MLLLAQTIAAAIAAIFKSSISDEFTSADQLFKLGDAVHDCHHNKDANGSLQQCFRVHRFRSSTARVEGKCRGKLGALAHARNCAPVDAGDCSFRFVRSDRLLRDSRPTRAQRAVAESLNPLVVEQRIDACRVDA